ncbi:FtsH-binding integral membrane protein [Kitasatospora sp. MAP12-15]|uniref:hypothetical protein n=1 Tax=unclassified Kitasatospora TaxID=2633591 RepID=UPI002474A51E|nr:hypothetical protein [Kitasatospora sp. MAP12-44]MDH6112674.1 FtsH-binding integral membrane protein [Kitasatospora sp. MAP12-44]
MPLPVAALVFALIGLLAGFGVLAVLPEYFPMARGLTIGTALVSALLSGTVTRYTLNGVTPAVCIALTVLFTGLLTSVLARPDLAAARHGSHRGHRRRHRAA